MDISFNRVPIVICWRCAESEIGVSQQSDQEFWEEIIEEGWSYDPSDQSWQCEDCCVIQFIETEIFNRDCEEHEMINRAEIESAQQFGSDHCYCDPSNCPH